MPVVATTASIKGEEGAPRAAIERLPQPRWLPVHDSPEKSCLRAQNRPTADVKKQLSRLSGVLGERRQSISRAEWVWSGDQRLWTEASMALQRGNDELQDRTPRAEWDFLAPGLLDIVKTQLEKSEVNDDIMAQVLGSSRLVNRHWSAWATEATTMLRAPRCYVPLGQLVERIVRNFVNLSSLQLGRMDFITDDGLEALQSLPNLTRLDLGPSTSSQFVRITDVGMGHLGRLSVLRDLSLNSCREITDFGLEMLTYLKSLQKLSLHHCDKATNLGASYIGFLTTLTDLSICGCRHITDAGIKHLVSLKMLTKLDLSGCINITNETTGVLGAIIALRNLDLGDCSKITNLGVNRLASLTALTKLSLSGCHKITDEGASSLGRLKTIKDLNLQHCIQITDVGVRSLISLPSLTKLHLDNNGTVTRVQGSVWEPSSY